MDITGVDFITIPTQDFERSRKFYGETLGLEPSKKWGDFPAQEFETGSLTLARVQTDAFGAEFSAHKQPVAFQVEDVAAARAELEDQGVEFIMESIDSGVCHMAHFKDPDGNVLMLHQRYAPKDSRPS